MNDHFDVLIIGAGQAAVPLANELSKAGKRVAVAEREHLGGSCVNFGCTPTKAVIASAKLVHQARQASEYGLTIPEVTVDFKAVLDRAKAVRDDSRQSLAKSFGGEDSPTLIKGHARFTGKGEKGFELTVDDKIVTADRVVLDVGTRSLIPDTDGLQDLEFIHAGNWLEHDNLPEHLIILGGGYIGAEMSQFYRRLGAEVTVIQDGSQLASHEDEDVAERLQGILEDEGITLKLNAKARAVEKQGDGVRVKLEQAGEATTLEGSHLFVATGRKPNTDDLGLETVGLKPDDKGILKVDDCLATEVDGIWVAGDVRGGPMFTHTAYDDYRVLASQLIGDGSRTTERIVPYAMFIDPQLGRVGITEREAKKAGKTYKTASYEMKSNGRAREEGKTEGFIKVLVGEDDSLLGAAVLAAEGAEMVHSYITLMNAGAPYTVILNAIHIHPTYGEAIQSVFKDFEK